jgi:hypothetical protein
MLHSTHVCAWETRRGGGCGGRGEGTLVVARHGLFQVFSWRTSQDVTLRDPCGRPPWALSGAGFFRRRCTRRGGSGGGRGEGTLVVARVGLEWSARFPDFWGESLLEGVKSSEYSNARGEFTTLS